MTYYSCEALISGIENKANTHKTHYLDTTRSLTRDFSIKKFVF